MKNILYCGFGWADNIGNAFIDYGIKYSITKVRPDYNYLTASNVPNFLKHKYVTRMNFLNFQNNPASKLDLRQLIDTDYIVLGGSLFNRNWFITNKAFIQNLIDSHKKVIVLGGGGGNKYKDKDYIRNFLDKINFYALISRDSRTYNFYGDLAQNAYDGIDNAFFLSDYFRPAKLLKEDFIVSCFDFIKEPVLDIDRENEIIRLSHSAWEVNRLERFFKNPIKTLKFVGNYDLISDYPDDYLHFYANAKETYSDRVHACVATLTFGGKTRYYDKSDRSYLFERVGLADIRNKLVELDKDRIKIEKENQLNFLDKILI